MPTPLFKAKLAPDVISLPARTVLAFDGAGPPEAPAFAKAMAALYGVAYTLKFACKAEQRDFKLGPLEGRWWASLKGKAFSQAPRDKWLWQLRLAIPGDVTPSEVADAIHTATTRKGGKLEHSVEALSVRLERLPAQRVGRALHIGPYADEPRTFSKIDEALAAAHVTPAFSHLEVYLNDPRRTEPEKLKTVLLRETA
jgi:hypothetical protein